MEQPKKMKKEKSTAPRKENKWITHVKLFASENGINYALALKDPRTKASYREEPEILKETVKYRRDKERVMRPVEPPKKEDTFVLRELTKQKMSMKKEDKTNARKQRNMMRDAELDRVKQELEKMSIMPPPKPEMTAKQLARKIKNIELTAQVRRDKELQKLK